MASVAVERYLGRTDDPVVKKDLFIDLMGDVTFVFPCVNTARYHRGEPPRWHRKQHRPRCCLSCPALGGNTDVEAAEAVEVGLSRPLPHGSRWGAVPVWFQPKADSEKKIRRQLSYLEMVPENTSSGAEKWHGREREAAGASRGQRERRSSEEDAGDMSRGYPEQPGSQGIYPPALQVIGWRLFPRGC